MQTLRPSIPTIADGSFSHGQKATPLRTDANPGPRSGSCKTTSSIAHTAARQEACKAHPRQRHPGKISFPLHSPLRPSAKPGTTYAFFLPRSMPMLASICRKAFSISS